MVIAENLFILFGNESNLILMLYPLLGAGIKYIDSAYDNGTFNKTTALLLSPLLGGFWTFTMLINTWSATILFSVLIGVLIKGKIDNRAHIIGFLSILLFMMIFGIIPPIVPLTFLIAAAVLDEVGHDVMEYNEKNLRKYQFRHQFSLYFFGRRYLMKVAIIYLILIGLFPLESFVAFLFFDEAYIITGLYSKSREMRKGNSDKLLTDVM
jgi:hypothetical protein